jgi:hypothetical protein
LLFGWCEAAGSVLLCRQNSVSGQQRLWLDESAQNASLIGGDRRNSSGSSAKFTANRRVSSRDSRFGRRAMRGREAEALRFALEIR